MQVQMAATVEMEDMTETAEQAETAEKLLQSYLIALDKVT